MSVASPHTDIAICVKITIELVSLILEVKFALVDLGYDVMANAIPPRNHCIPHK
jgi:hypothetical protein